ncbi:hypothetical protein BSLG_006548 [Batrachochytrium salamandrivorans]|nr:hypothetical protein BSLG_006548 [Batrachochytrium salamandrivorans]
MLITISVTFTLSWFYLQENKPIQPYAANDHIQTYAANDSIQPHAANDHIQSYAANDQIQHEVEPIQEKIYDDKTWDFGHGGQLQSRVKTHHKTERLLAANTMCRDGWDQYLSVTKCKDDITLASVTGPDGFLANPLAANATAVAELNSAIGIIRPSTIVADEHSMNTAVLSIHRVQYNGSHTVHTVVLPEDRLILWSDADDVIITPETTIDKIMQQYKALVDLANGPRVVFAAESPCYPRGDLWRNYTKPSDIPGGRGDSPFRYLNAGFMIGPAGLIRRMIEVVYQHDCFDDQLVYTLAYLDPLVWWRDAHTNEYQVSSSRQNRTEIPYYAKQLIQLDHWNLLSMAMYGVKNEKYVVDDANTRLTMLETNSNPLILHQSGQKTTNRILEILAMVFGYDYDAPALDKLEEEGHPFRLMSRP